MNESNNKTTGNDKTLTELFNNLLLEITTKSRTLVDNSTRERNTSNDNSDNVNEEVEKQKRLHYQIYRSQQLSRYYEPLINQERPCVPAKF